MTIVDQPPRTSRPDSGDPGRTQPQDITAEISVLGAMLLSTDAIADVVEILKTGDFYRPAHARVFDAILDLYGRGEPADAVTVASALRMAGDLATIGGAPYLHTLISGVPTAANASYYARIVAECAELRRIIVAGTRVVQMGYAGRQHADDNIADRVTQVVHQALSIDESTIEMPTSEILRETFEQIERTAAGEGRGLPIGLRDFDDLTGGLQPGQLVLVAGRPGVGKSVVGMDAACHVALRLGRGVQVFNLEMPRTEIMMRILSAECRIPFHAIRHAKKLTDDDWTLMARRGAEITESPLHIDDSPHQTLATIAAKARRRKQRGDLALIVVDYLQLLTPSRRVESRQLEIEETSRGLKLLAKELEVPVIAACQLNRGPEQRTDKQPQLADLRGSGSLEQDSDIVVLLHRDDYYDKESPRAGEVDLIVAKNRSGPMDTITAAAQLHFMRFVDMAIVE